MSETRPVSLVDIPLVRRLTDHGVVLDARTGCTQAADGPNSRVLTSLIPNSSVHTLVAKAGEQQVAAQFQFTADSPNAQIVYIAPGLEAEADNTAWLLAFDAMVEEAGRRGAHTISADVNENSVLFTTMRNSGFAVYARQQLWRHMPGEPLTVPGEAVEVDEATEHDFNGIHALYSSTVPSLLQQVGTPPGDSGYIYRKNGHVAAYISVDVGRDGVYLLPYIDPDVLPEAAAIIAATIGQIPKATRRPTWLRIRRYQGWLCEAADALGMACVMQQAVMVRHIAAGIHQPEFATLRETIVKAATPIRPPTTRMGEHAFDYYAMMLRTRLAEAETKKNNNHSANGSKGDGFAPGAL